jgi:hypothetical protein
VNTQNQAVLATQDADRMAEAILHPREQCLNEENKQQAIALGG